METHVKVISVIDIVLGALTAIGGLFLLFAFPAVIASLEGITAAASAGLTALGVVSGTFVVAVGILGIVVGVKLSDRRNWARIMQIVFGILMLFNFPVGTVFGIYSLWAMLSEQGTAYFMEAEERMRRAA